MPRLRRLAVLSSLAAVAVGAATLALALPQIDGPLGGFTSPLGDAVMHEPDALDTIPEGAVLYFDQSGGLDAVVTDGDTADIQDRAEALHAL